MALRCASAEALVDWSWCLVPLGARSTPFSLPAPCTMTSPLSVPPPGAPQRTTAGASGVKDEHHAACVQKPASKSTTARFVSFVNSAATLAVVSGGSAYLACNTLGGTLGNTLGDKVVTAGERLGERGGDRIFAGLVLGSCVLAVAAKHARPQALCRPVPGPAARTRLEGALRAHARLSGRLRVCLHSYALSPVSQKRPPQGARARVRVPGARGPRWLLKSAAPIRVAGTLHAAHRPTPRRTHSDVVSGRAESFSTALVHSSVPPRVGVRAWSRRQVP